MDHLLQTLPDLHRYVLHRMARLAASNRAWRVALVGGAVRDVFAELEPSDLDFVVQGCASGDVLRVAVEERFDCVETTGFGGVRFEVEGVQVDMWRVELNVLRACSTVEEIVGADLGRPGAFTFDADCGAVDVDPTRSGVLIDGGLGRVMETGAFDLRRARGAKLPPSWVVLAKAANLVDRYGWDFGPVLREYVERHDDAGSWSRAAAFAAQTGKARLTKSRIRKLLTGDA